MSDLFGNHIVGFPTRRLIYRLQDQIFIEENMLEKKVNMGSALLMGILLKPANHTVKEFNLHGGCEVKRADCIIQ